MNSLLIAMQYVSVPETGTIEARLSSAMSDVKQRESEIFWILGKVDDNTRFRVAVGAVMLHCNAEEKGRIEASLKPLYMLAAAISGIPVDFSQMESDDLIPLMKLWDESK